MKNLFSGHLFVGILLTTGVFALLSSSFGCQKQAKEADSSLIATPKPVADSVLVSMLADFHIAEATVKDLRFRKDTAILKQLRPIGSYYAEILAIHNISPEELAAGIDYYADKPVLFDALYEKVVNHLSKMDGELKGAPERTDSMMIKQATKRRTVADSLNVLKSKKGAIKYAPPVRNTSDAVPTKPRTRPTTRVKPKRKKQAE